MSTPKARRRKRQLTTLSCSSSISSDDDDRPHKKLALSLDRLSLNSTPVPPDPEDVDMHPRRSYEKDKFTTVIESLSTTTSEDEQEDPPQTATRDAPFPRDEAHVTILSEIEKRLTQFPHRLLAPVIPETALVLYRSPESMGLPKLERQHQEDLKHEVRKRILERRRQQEKLEMGYEADGEDWEEIPTVRSNGHNGTLSSRSGIVNHEHESSDEDDESDKMDLDE
jgi:hypothetical protein